MCKKNMSRAQYTTFVDANQYTWINACYNIYIM